MTQEFVTLPREFVERALEALKYEKDANNPLDWHHDKTMNALRAALEQEPAAYWIPKPEQFCVARPGEWPFAKAWQPLYIHPQPKREPLTDEQIEKICPSFDDPLRSEMWKIGFKAAHNIK